jgi:uncharacterized cupin superfamily protein
MPSKDLVILPSIATDDDLVAAPINPAWILEGTPVARSRPLAFIDDSTLSAMLWETTAGRFEWHYNSDELVQILDGEVELTPPGGKPMIIRRGDIVFFPGGQVVQWHVREYVKKVAINAVRTPILRRIAAQVPFARRFVRRLRVVRSHP